MLSEPIPISTVEYYSRLQAEDCRTLSARSWPGQGARTHEYLVSAADFLAGDVYLVRFVDRSRTRIVAWDDPQAAPITVREFARHPEFVREVLEDWSGAGPGPINNAELIVLHCSGCDRRIVIDGVHRILWIANQESAEATLRVTELSGAMWPRETPDLNVVCACYKDNGAEAADGSHTERAQC